MRGRRDGGQRVVDPRASSRAKAAQMRARLIVATLLVSAPAFADDWTLMPNMTVGRHRHAAVELSSGAVLVTGGCTGNNSVEACGGICGTVTDTSDIFDPMAKTWR